MHERPNICIFLKSWVFKDVKYDIPMCQYHSTRPQPIQLVPTMQKISLRHNFRPNLGKLGSQRNWVKTFLLPKMTHLTARKWPKMSEKIIGITFVVKCRSCRIYALLSSNPPECLDKGVGRGSSQSRQCLNFKNICSSHPSLSVVVFHSQFLVKYFHFFQDLFLLHDCIIFPEDICIDSLTSCNAVEGLRWVRFNAVSTFRTALFPSLQKNIYLSYHSANPSRVSYLKTRQFPGNTVAFLY